MATSRLLSNLAAQPRPVVDTPGLLVYMKQLQDFWESGAEFVSFYEDTKLDTLILLTEIAKLTLYSELSALGHFLALLDVQTEDRVWSCIGELRRTSFARLAACHVSPDTAEALQRFLRKAGVEVYPHGGKFEKDARSLFVVQTALRERVHKIMERLDNPLDRGQSKLAILTKENKDLKEKLLALDDVYLENAKLKNNVEQLQTELGTMHAQASEIAGMQDALKKARSLVLDYEKVVTDLQLRLDVAEKPRETANVFVQAEVRVYDKGTDPTQLFLHAVKTPGVCIDMKSAENSSTQTAVTSLAHAQIQTETIAQTKQQAKGASRNFDLRISRPASATTRIEAADDKDPAALEAEIQRLQKKIDALNKELKEVQNEFKRRTLQFEDIIANLKKDNEEKTNTLMKLQEQRPAKRTLVPATPVDNVPTSRRAAREELVNEYRPSSRPRSRSETKKRFVHSSGIHKRFPVYRNITRVTTPLKNIFARLYGDAKLRKDRLLARQKFAHDRKEFDLLTKDIDKKYASNFSFSDEKPSLTYPLPEREQPHNSASIFGWFTARQSHSRFFASSSFVAPDAPPLETDSEFTVIGRSRVGFLGSRGSSRRNLSL